MEITIIKLWESLFTLLIIALIYYLYKEGKVMFKKNNNNYRKEFVKKINKFVFEAKEKEILIYEYEVAEYIENKYQIDKEKILCLLMMCDIGFEDKDVKVQTNMAIAIINLCYSDIEIVYEELYNGFLKINGSDTKKIWLN